jgi:hypothetical protein
MSTHDQNEKLVTIIVNGTPHEWPKDTDITYADVVTLDLGSYNPGITYAVNYERGQGNKPEGQLSKGGKPVKVKDGMIFSVSSTGQS